MLDEVLHLVACGIAKRFDPAELGRIGLDQVRIELMLADYLAESVTDCTRAIAAGGSGRNPSLP
jgi:hypothetical protein